MKHKNRYHIQSTITEEANPGLCSWWRSCDNRSAIVREALTTYLAQSNSLQRISEQLDRVEDTLERCLRLLEEVNK